MMRENGSSFKKRKAKNDCADIMAETRIQFQNKKDPMQITFCKVNKKKPKKNNKIKMEVDQNERQVHIQIRPKDFEEQKLEEVK